MKAKTLANNFKADGFTANSLTTIILSLATDVGKIMEDRKISDRNPRAIVAVFDEVNGKWKAFVKRVNGMRSFKGQLEDGLFMESYYKLRPEIAGALKKLRKAMK